jgi:antitoxin (DNA-binding transcriptional repressor) of toxin-antitoxin stability system
MATTIAQRELCNQMPAVLRRVEQGERFTVAVNGRPTAELGPLAGERDFAPPEALADIFAEAPPDLAWAHELRAARAEERAAVGET